MSVLVAQIGLAHARILGFIEYKLAVVDAGGLHFVNIEGVAGAIFGENLDLLYLVFGFIDLHAHFAVFAIFVGRLKLDGNARCVLIGDGVEEIFVDLVEIQYFIGRKQVFIIGVEVGNLHLVLLFHIHPDGFSVANHLVAVVGDPKFAVFLEDFALLDFFIFAVFDGQRIIYLGRFYGFVLIAQLGNDFFGFGVALFHKWFGRAALRKERLGAKKQRSEAEKSEYSERFHDMYAVVSVSL